MSAESTAVETSAAAYAQAGQPVSQEQFYRAACNPQRSVVVEACAGAGKTWMLVSRILRALLDGAQPQQILAVTFTRKAAGEMRERLGQWLAEFSDAASTHEQRVDQLRLRGMSAAQAELMAPALGQLQQHLHTTAQGVQVHTFHSWFAQLVKNAPFATLQRLGLPQRFTLLDDSSVLYNAVFRRFYERLQATPALTQDHALLIARHRRHTVQQWFINALGNATQVLCADEAGALLPSVPPASILDAACVGLGSPSALLQAAPLREQLLALAKALARHKNARPRNEGDKLLRGLESQDTDAGLELAYSALFTDKRLPRELPEIDGLVEARDALTHLDALERQHQAHLDHGRLVGLVRVLLHEFAALKFERGVIDMNDLERAARSMLADEAVSGWVHERLDLRVRHVLVDEFQDTNPLQWQALHAWLSGYAGAGGGASGQRPPSVFIVGDPKQSIYRFRGAEPQVFEAAKDFVTQGLGGVVLACDHTRRCSPQVLAQVNAVFLAALARAEWQDFRVHTTHSKTSGKVHSLYAPERPPNKRKKDEDDAPWRPSLTQARTEPETRLRSIETAQVACCVTELLTQGGFAAGDIMVLARKRDVLHHIAAALAQAQVAHVMPEALSLAESPEALDLIAVLDVLASPGHNLSLARALKSPLFGASDDDLLWLAQQVAADGAPWLSVLLASQPTSLALRRAQGLLGAWLARVQRLSPHELIDQVVHEGDLIARMAAVVPQAGWPTALGAVNAVLSAAITQDHGRFGTLYALVRALLSGEVRMPATVPTNAVQLLTVHGAKGLEAKVVFVVDSDAAAPKAKVGVLLCRWPVDRAAPSSLAFFAKEAMPPPSLVDALESEQTARQREELNALYVAMTRASERLVFSATPSSSGQSQTSWWSRWTLQVSPEAPRLFVAGAVASDPSPQVPALPLLQASPSAQPAAKPQQPDAAFDERQSRLGQAVHRLLEWAGRPQAPVPPDRLASLATQAARAFGLLNADSDDILRAASAVLSSASCRRFFSGADLLWAGTEVSLAHGGQVLRLDRVVRLQVQGQTQWWVLDYKLHAAPDQVVPYREQLHRYQQALQQLVPQETVLAAFIGAGGALLEL